MIPHWSNDGNRPGTKSVLSPLAIEMRNMHPGDEIPIKEAQISAAYSAARRIRKYRDKNATTSGDTEFPYAQRAYSILKDPLSPTGYTLTRWA